MTDKGQEEKTTVPAAPVAPKSPMVELKQYVVPEGYRGRSTKEFYVEAGTWDEDAPELNGYGDVLVLLGKATVSTRKVRARPTE